MVGGFAVRRGLPHHPLPQLGKSASNDLTTHNPTTPMPAPNPDTLKSVKDFQRPVITFSVARKPGTDTVFLGCSDFKVYSADLAVTKFEPKEMERLPIPDLALLTT